MSKVDKNISIIGFADDLSVVVRGRTKEEVFSKANRLGEAIADLLDKSASIKVAPEKTCIISMGELIEVNDKVDFLGAQVKIDISARYLGLILGQNCNIEGHVKKQSGKIRARSIGCEKMSKLGNPLFAARSFVNIADGLTNYALPVCKLSTNQIKTLENARNDGLKTCLKMHYRQIGRPVNQIELFEKVGGARSVENNLKFLSVSIASTVFETKKPADLYSELVKCLKIDGSPALTPQAFNTMTPKEKAQNWAIFWEKIRAGEYGPKINFPDDMTTEEKNDPVIQSTWPLCLMESFNEMPPMLRGMIGTYSFHSEARGWFASKCQHFISHGENCKYCKVPKRKPDLTKIKGPLDNFSKSEISHMMKMCSDSKNAWKIRKGIKAPVENYWPQKPIMGFNLDYDSIV